MRCNFSKHNKNCILVIPFIDKCCECTIKRTWYRLFKFFEGLEKYKHGFTPFVEGDFLSMSVAFIFFQQDDAKHSFE